MAGRRGGSGADLVKMWLIGIVFVVAVGFAAAQVDANRGTPAGMIAVPVYEALEPIVMVLGIGYGAILLIATAVYLIRRARA